MNKTIILIGTFLFVLACLFPYKKGSISKWGYPYTEVDGFYFFLQDSESRVLKKEVCAKENYDYYTNQKTCLYTKEERETATGGLRTSTESLIIELVAIAFGTLGLAFALGKKKGAK